MNTETLPKRDLFLGYLKVRQIAGVLILCVSLAFLLWGLWPSERETRTLLFQPAELQPLAAEPDSTGPAAQPDRLESRRILLEWPETIRAGDAAVIRLDLNSDSRGLVHPAAGQGHTAQSTSLYDTHNLVAEAFFDLPGVQMAPAGEISEPLRPGHAATFLWNVRPPNAGEYSGMLWLRLQFVPLDGGPESRRPLSAQRIELHSTSLLGMNGRLARVLGGAGMVFGVLLSFGVSIFRLAGRFLNKPGGE